MSYEILIGALSLIALVAGVIKPLFELNKNITLLTVSVDALNKTLSELKERVDTHGKEIDNINVELADHEARIKMLEKQ